MNVKLVALVASALFAAACGPSIVPELKSDTDSFLAKLGQSKRSVKAAGSLDVQAWKVGQWALYATTDDEGRPGYERLSVVRQDSCGIWLQIERQTYFNRQLQQICYKRMPKPPGDVRKAVDDALDMVQVMKTKVDDNPTQVIDLRAMPGMKFMMRSVAQGIVTGVWLDPKAPQETKTVRGGTFEGAVKMNVTATILFVTVQATTWSHPDVPVNALVKSVTDSGYTQELLDYGATGAEDKPL